jgi:hypothetical protein
MDLHDVEWDKVQVYVVQNRASWASVLNVVMNTEGP